MKKDLPQPDAAASAQSMALCQRIREEIRPTGWISFARYMQLALYEPGLGYYSGGAHKIGAAGDFVTAPESSPLFGQALAHEIAPLLHATAGNLLELGAGSGALAIQLLSTLEALGSLPQHYDILEVSADLQARQKARIAKELPHLAPRVRWLQALPERLDGVVVANEVLDALPVELLKWHQGRIWQRGVALAGEDFTFQDQPLTSGLLHARARAISAELPASLTYVSEIGLEAEALVATLAERLERGMLLFIDYGFGRAEYYHPQRHMGTLNCHYRHHSLDDPFYLPGLSDITAHVDFSAVYETAAQQGLELYGYATQGNWLINRGVLDWLPDDRNLPYFKAAAALQILVAPHEMGELFKIIALGRNLEVRLDTLIRSDRSHQL